MATLSSRRPNPMFRSIDEVRRAASGTSFYAVRHNRSSKVLSFRSNTQQARINVHYSTGTVGTRLDDGTRGTTTQLFRRNVGLEGLVDIFRDPARYSGKGYFQCRIQHKQEEREESESNVSSSTNNATQSHSPASTQQQLFNTAQSTTWKIRTIDGHEVCVFDSAKRWEYVASATGLSNSESELEKIMDFCNSWDSIYWDHDSEPKLTQTRFSCGSQKVLCNMLLKCARDLYGRRVRGMYIGPNGTPDRNREIIKEEGSCCNKVGGFLREYSKEVYALRRQLHAFRPEIRIELMRWFFARDHCGYWLVDDNGMPLTTEYASEVDSAHKEYGTLHYSQNRTPKGRPQMCLVHGVVYEDDESSSIPRPTITKSR